MPKTGPTIYIRTKLDSNATKAIAVLEAIGFQVVRAATHDSMAVESLIADFVRRFKLTPREGDILDHVIRGSKPDAVALALDITFATVKWHMHNIFTKTETPDREALLRCVLQLDAIEPAKIQAPKRVASPSKAWF